MDIGFFAFVLAIALMAALGAVMLLVGYIVVIPASITRGWLWAALVILVPVLGPIFFAERFPMDCLRRVARSFRHPASDGRSGATLWRWPMVRPAHG